jgi:hypothetical protein
MKTEKIINYYKLEMLSNTLIVCTYNTLKNKTFKAELEKYTDEKFMERAKVTKLDIPQMYKLKKQGICGYHWHDNRLAW